MLPQTLLVRLPTPVIFRIASDRSGNISTFAARSAACIGEVSCSVYCCSGFVKASDKASVGLSDSSKLSICARTGRIASSTTERARRTTRSSGK